LSLCCALTGLQYWLIFTQGVALGWYVAALSGLTFGDHDMVVIKNDKTFKPVEF
jgi:hypothetical protein